MSIADRLRTIPSLTGTAPGLDLDALPPDPHDLFTEWLATALAGTASSRKAAQLAANPAAALSLWWQPQMRAVRVRGPVVAATPQECEADLAARSPQARATVPPGEWRVWRVQPERIEYWQGSPDRQHIRIIYGRDGDGWTRTVDRGENAR